MVHEVHVLNRKSGMGARSLPHKRLLREEGACTSLGDGLLSYADASNPERGFLVDGCLTVVVDIRFIDGPEVIGGAAAQVAIDEPQKEANDIGQLLLKDGSARFVGAPLHPSGLVGLFTRPSSLCSDVEVVAGGQSFALHKCILGMRSPVFKAMFASPMVESKAAGASVELEDIAGAVFQHLAE
jgi:hypothetical protein